MSARCLSRTFVLRSGGADGCDSIFEKVWDEDESRKKEIFIPWRGFNKRQGPKCSVPRFDQSVADKVLKINPHLYKTPHSHLLLHTRNYYQIFGEESISRFNSFGHSLPSLFVVCWTPCGSERRETITRSSGGTRTGIILASQFGIPIFNMNRTDSPFERMYAYASSCFNHRDLISQVFEVYDGTEKSFEIFKNMIADIKISV
jgi:hypothetical protein